MPRLPSFITGSAIYLFSNILNAAIPFLLLPVLTRTLGAEQYGELAMFQTLVQALMAFVGVTIVGSAVRKYYDQGVEQHNMAQFIGACFQIIVVLSLLVLLVLYLFDNEISSWLALDKKWVIASVIAATSVVILQLRLGQWQASKKALNYGFLQVSNSLAKFALVLVFVVVLEQGANGAIKGIIYSAAIIALIAVLFLLRDKLFVIFQVNTQYIAEALRFGIPLVPHIGGAFLIFAVDRFVINDKLGLNAAGNYMVAVQIAAGVKIIFDAINKAFVPWLYEQLAKDSLEQKKKIVRLTYLWFVIILLGAALGFVIGPWLVNQLAGKGYEQAASVIGLLLLGQGFGGMYLMVTNYIFYSKRTGVLAITTLSSGLLNLLLLIWFIALWGIKGAAIAYCISMAVLFLSAWVAAQKLHPMPWASFRKS